MKPTPGRVVWYTPNPNRSVIAGQPHAAIVAAVNPDGSVNLAVFDAQGYPYAEQNVRLLGVDEPAPGGAHSFAEWMPYQKGQAAKTEDVTAGLAAELAALYAKVQVLESIVTGRPMLFPDKLDGDQGDGSAGDKPAGAEPASLTGLTS